VLTSMFMAAPRRRLSSNCPKLTPMVSRNIFRKCEVLRLQARAASDTLVRRDGGG
jgi:hypothetical protein